MNAVEKRIAAQLKADIKASESALKVVEAKRAKLSTEGTKIRNVLDGQWEKLTTYVNVKPDEALAKRLISVMNEIVKLNTKVLSLKATHEQLSSPGELERRTTLAVALGVGDEPMSGPKAAQVVLLHAGKALPVDEITRTMLEAGTVKLAGKTPGQTISAYLAKAAKRDDTFVRISPGVFDLKEREKATA